MHIRRKTIADNLLSWYDANKRELPWRMTNDPYAIWVSEIMAQQTRITALLPYYKRFMASFPTVQALAQAKEDDVLKIWEGLGYYTRARNLHKAAHIIVREYDGQIPSSDCELRQLPGIGPYTAGAILGIAFHKPVPAVDGNVLRVYTRIENDDIDICTSAAKKAATAFVDALMPMRVSAFTQALMELGALVCVTGTPNCAICPISSLCRGYAAGRQAGLPKKSAKKPKKHLDKTILLICNPDGGILMRQRTERLLCGMWVFYMVDERLNAGFLQKHLSSIGYTMEQADPIGEARHVFTHLTWDMDGFFCRVQERSVRKSLSAQGYTFLNNQDIQHAAIPTAVRFYLDWLVNR